MNRKLQTIASSDATYTTTPDQDVLAMAMGSGISALSSSPHISHKVVAKVIPELEALWRAGARHMEGGCGVGNSLFGTLTAYPAVTAVGVEISELVAAKAERRARVLGLADRVQVRAMDARELQDENAFDTIQWSQFFFSTASRPAVLGALHRGLKPGGYPLMPWLGSTSEDEQAGPWEMLRRAAKAIRSGGISFLVYFNDALGNTTKRRKKERRSAALNRLLFARWGVPVGTVAELESELASSGFVVVRAMHVPVSQFALTRGMLLVQRPEL